MTFRRKLPPLNALVAFEAAARHKNYTRAAEELSVAQPAVTRHIHNLEIWIGGPVFTRQGNRVALTPRGQELAELATAVLDRLELGLQPLVGQDESELRIGASFGVAHLWLMPRISAMRAAAGTTINFLTSDNYQNFDDISVDASIRFGNGDFGNLASDLLFPETCQIIASPAFLAAHPGFDPVRLGETINPTRMFDHGDPHGYGWVTWETFAAETGQPLSKNMPFKKVESYPMMLDMICAGEGIGIGILGFEDDLVDKGQLVRIGPKFGREQAGYHFVYPVWALQKKALRKLRRFLIGDKSEMGLASTLN